VSLSQWPSEVPRIAARDPAGHKGTFGRVLVVGGCVQPPLIMVGGPSLAAIAALRCGCGLAELAMPAPLLVAGLTLAPSAVGHAIEIDAHGGATVGALQALAQRAAVAEAVVCGPGLGANAGPVVHSMIASAPRLVLDADALNALATAPDPRAALRARRPGTTVLTPHVGEARRLARACGMHDSATASELAAALGVVVVLKSHETSIADADHAWTVRAGTSALATAGSGDVLAGVLAGLWAQQTECPTFDVARQAVCLHGLASVQWSAEHGHAGLLAQDLAAAIPAELERWRLGGTAAMR
jgi:NAD(P)H-hydrate epimerase